MNEAINILETIESIIKKDPRYKLDAYSFVLEALHYTVKRLKEARHVSGLELLEGIKLYAKEQFGPMARTVFEHWGVQTTEDFGHIVFSLVEARILSKTEQDSIDDFKNGYNFEQVFG
ncbi:MAG: Minf_1886 family protein [Candidatus Omnitrophota bacterium]